MGIDVICLLYCLRTCLLVLLTSSFWNRQRKVKAAMVIHSRMRDKYAWAYSDAHSPLIPCGAVAVWHDLHRPASLCHFSRGTAATDGSPSSPAPCLRAMFWAGSLRPVLPTSLGASSSEPRGLAPPFHQRSSRSSQSWRRWARIEQRQRTRDTSHPPRHWQRRNTGNSDHNAPNAPRNSTQGLEDLRPPKQRGTTARISNGVRA